MQNQKNLFFKTLIFQQPNLSIEYSTFHWYLEIKTYINIGTKQFKITWLNAAYVIN